METTLKKVYVGKKFVHEGKTYLKCRTTIAQVVPILYQVLAVNLATGEIKSFYEGETVETVQ